MLDLCRPAAELLQLQQTLMEQCFPASTVLLPSGAQVAVRQCGQRSGKPSIVLLHGISSGAASWLHPALLLAEHHHVLAWDAPGYGESTPLSDTSPSAQAYAERLNELLQTNPNPDFQALFGQFWAPMAGVFVLAVVLPFALKGLQAALGRKASA